jgi:hypothetical protein
MTLEEMLRIVSERPELYIGERSLSRFASFLLGWQFSQVDTNAFDKMQAFGNWISKKYGQEPSAHGWESIVRFYSPNDVEAMDIAISLLKEFFNIDMSKAIN